MIKPIALLLTLFTVSGLFAADLPPLLNLQSGISITLSGENGVDWVVENTFHDPEITDQLLYVRSGVKFGFAHNERNSLMNRTVKVPPVPGVSGADGRPRSGDEGVILVKIDRDLQSHAYSSVAGTPPEWVMSFPEPFTFAELTYDGVKPVLGTVGDNGAAWGSSPRNNPERYAYGQLDEFGNEWHTVTYWDDDGPVYSKANVNPHRQAASDGHWIYVCVNPVTPVLQLTAPEGEQFYSTPLKTWFVPKTWSRRSFVTGGVQIHFQNLTDNQAVWMKRGEDPWVVYSGTAFPASALGIADGESVLLSFRIGEDGAVASREIVMNPAYPAPEENPGRLLWPTDAVRETQIRKLREVEPFASAYNALKSGAANPPGEFSLIRGGWRDGAALASSTLTHAFIPFVEGVDNATASAVYAKNALLRLARLEPVGNEADVNRATPSKDYLNELSQTIQLYSDAGIAYDMLAAVFRSNQHPQGMTPIEEIRIRDGLAEIAKSMLQVRSNWSFQQGGGDTHWAHGFEVMFGTLAAAMPTYSTPYFGASGVASVPAAPDENGKYWSPFPDQAVTWWAAATDPDIPTPGFPNVKAPLRAEMLYRDDGWWVGPNDFKGDGDRYFQGGLRRQLVDLNHGGMANAEARVELVEMDGYEAPFVSRLYVFHHIRRLRGDTRQQTGVETYLRRRVMGGFTPLQWDQNEKIYRAQAPRMHSSFEGFTWLENGARYPRARAAMQAQLDDISRFYGKLEGAPSSEATHTRKALGGVYALALCADPASLPPPESEPNFPPILKPLMKHVVRPGERIHKTLIVQDLNEDPLEIELDGLPAGAAYDAETRTIDWRPGAADAGVHLITVRVSDGKAETRAPFFAIVKPDAPAGDIPAPPANVEVRREGDRAHLSWQASASATALYTIIYRDGAPQTVLPAGTLRYTDSGLPPGSHTRYALSTIDNAGAESFVATPGEIVHRPFDE